MTKALSVSPGATTRPMGVLRSLTIVWSATSAGGSVSGLVLSDAVATAEADSIGRADAAGLAAAYRAAGDHDDRQDQQPD